MKRRGRRLLGLGLGLGAATLVLAMAAAGFAMLVSGALSDGGGE